MGTAADLSSSAQGTQHSLHHALQDEMIFYARTIFSVQLSAINWFGKKSVVVI